MAEHNSVRGVAVSGIDRVKRRLPSLSTTSRTRPNGRRRLAARLAGAFLWLQPAQAEDLLLQSGEALISTRIDGTHGRPVVFISGLDEEMDNRDRVAPSIARCARVVRYDRPGIGSSRPAPDAPVPAQTVFVGAHQKRLPFDVVAALQARGRAVERLRVAPTPTGSVHELEDRSAPGGTTAS
jgi:pimeloyl-ACP methyl ester carboxylesterase